MKKLTTLILAAGLVVSSFAGASSAQAGEFKPFAQFTEEFVYGDGGNNIAGENFSAHTRIRFGFDYVASEDLSATLLFQYGGHEWGTHSHDNFTRDPDAELRMRLAYIDWTIPGTAVKARMGRQAVVAPSYAFGSAILDGRGDAISLNGNVNDNISLGLTWLRLVSDGVPTASFEEDDADAIMLTSEFAYDGWKLAPWAMYISKDKNADFAAGDKWGSSFPWNGINNPNNYLGSADAYVLGASFELSMFDPFVFAIDALYSNVEYGTTNNYISTIDGEDSFDGFFVGASASYKLNNGTVALKGWYATGDDLNENGHFNDNGFIVLDGGFGATTMMFGDNNIGDDNYNTLTGDTPFGTWGVVAEYAGFSFMDKLTHTARVAYIEGTNEAENWNNNRPDADPDFAYLTEDDSVVEINFNSTYEIYKNLSATLELGYMFVDFDNLAPNSDKDDDIFRSALVFNYNF